MSDHSALARRLIDQNDYMTLGTADESGRPWASPVFYAAEMHARFYWVSSPEARHSRHISSRQQVSIVIFDSRAPIGTAQAVYADAIARELTTAEAGRAIELYSRHSQARGARRWELQHVQDPAAHRLYRASACEFSVLDALDDSRPGDVRVPVTLGGDDFELRDRSDLQAGPQSRTQEGHGRHT